MGRKADSALIQSYQQKYRLAYNSHIFIRQSLSLKYH
jgi:hypothetical protein